MAGKIKYSLTLRANPSDPDMPKRAYATAQSEVMNLEEFSNHITSHGSVYNRGDVLAILAQAVDCMRELMLQGYAIQFGDLGKFYVSLSSKGAKDAESFTTANIRKINCKFKPSDYLKNLRDDAQFELVLTREEQAKARAAAYGSASSNG